MHGVLLNQFRQFIVEGSGREAWLELTLAAGTGADAYQISGTYPDEHFAALAAAAARRLGESEAVVLAAFGRFLVPTLLRVYGSLLDPSWRTLDVIARTEETVHRAVRLRDPTASPPVLAARREGDDVVLIDYASPRRLCPVAEGIARGLAEHFGERVEVTQPACMLRGDPRCAIRVRTLPPA
ncbi:MAG: hypothetical protein JWM10_2785 [Myxococcaceae bacterium]|nr:hypothetical protein [Myxococcaceae bacterium]